MLLRFIGQFLLAAQRVRRRVVQTILYTRRVDLGNVRARQRHVAAILAALSQVRLPSLLHGVIVVRTAQSSTADLLRRLEELLSVLVDECVIVEITLRTRVNLGRTREHREWRLCLIHVCRVNSDR